MKAKKEDLYCVAWNITAIAIALILASRNLYIALDDQNYLAHFEGSSTYLLNTSGWLWIVEDPLWSLFAQTLGAFAKPEIALRVTIFLGATLFLYSAGKLAPRAMAFLFFVFITDSALSTQMYFNQIRQGLALSIFLLGLANRKNHLLAFAALSFCSILIHPSLIVALIALLFTALTGETKERLWLTLIAAIIAPYVLQQTIGAIDLGRRTEIYDFKGKLNFNFYLLAGIQYSLVFYFLRRNFYDIDRKSFYIFCAITTATCFGISLIHEAGGRLFYISSALVAILVGTNIEKSNGKLAAALWSTFLIFYAINDFQQYKDSIFSRWIQILT